MEQKTHRDAKNKNKKNNLRTHTHTHTHTHTKLKIKIIPIWPMGLWVKMSTQCMVQFVLLDKKSCDMLIYFNRPTQFRYI